MLDSRHRYGILTLGTNTPYGLVHVFSSTPGSGLLQQIASHFLWNAPMTNVLPGLHFSPLQTLDGAKGNCYNRGKTSTLGLMLAT